MKKTCRNCQSLYGLPCQYQWSTKSKSYEKVCAALYSKKAEENEELQAKLDKAVEDNEKLEEKMTEAVKENEASCKFVWDGVKYEKECIKELIELRTKS